MQPIRTWTLAALAAAGTVWAAPADIKVVDEIVAKINGEIVTRSEVERNTAELRQELMRQNLAGPELEKAVAERSKDVLKELIDQSLLVQKGKELNISVEAQVIKYLDDMRRQYSIASMEEFEKWVVEKTGMPYEDLKDQVRTRFLTQRVIGQEISSRINIPKEELEKYYQEHKSEFVREEQVHLREILVSTEGKEVTEIPTLEKKAQDILARLKKGERFADLASKMSDNPDSAKNGGDIGFFKRGVLDKEIETIAFAARRGALTDVIKRKNGFLILRVEERYQPGQAPFEDVEQEITERLWTPRMEPALKEYLSRLRQNAFIEIRPGFVDSGAVAGQDTAWKDPEQFKPAVTTKAEATRKKRKLLWVVPMGTKQGKPGDAEPVPGRPSNTPPAAEVPKPDGPAVP